MVALLARHMNCSWKTNPLFRSDPCVSLARGAHFPLVFVEVYPTQQTTNYSPPAAVQKDGLLSMNRMQDFLENNRHWTQKHITRHHAALLSCENNTICCLILLAYQKQTKMAFYHLRKGLVNTILMNYILLFFVLNPFKMYIFLIMSPSAWFSPPEFCLWTSGCQRCFYKKDSFVLEPLIKVTACLKWCSSVFLKNSRDRIVSRLILATSQYSAEGWSVWSHVNVEGVTKTLQKTFFVHHHTAPEQF